jgi:hypothetical protein
MADYKALRGFTIHTVDGDPSNLISGQVWYNSSSKKVKGAKLTVGAWASGGDLTSGALKHKACFGTYQAAQATGGHNSAGEAKGFSEQYDGTSWTEVGDWNVNRGYVGNAGTTTAGLCMGGFDQTAAARNLSEEWNGSTWTEGNNLNATKYYAGSCGTQTAAMIVGGQNTTIGAQFETYDGTSWTEEDHGLNTARSACSGWGITTSALMTGGSTTADVGNTETYDGTSWSETGDLGKARNGEGGTSLATASVGTDGLRFGGSSSPPHQALTEQFNGTTWSELGDLPVALTGNGGTGTGSNALSVGGNSPPNTYRDDTYEWTGEHVAAAEFTSS